MEKLTNQTIPYKRDGQELSIDNKLSFTFEVLDMEEDFKALDRIFGVKKEIKTVRQLRDELNKILEKFDDLPISINDSATILDCYWDSYDKDDYHTEYWFQINTTDY